MLRASLGGRGSRKVRSTRGVQPAVRDWFESSFAEPTPAQAQAWPAIASGEHVLLSAPTGSGKTLAAFLWALDRLSARTRDSDMAAARAGASAMSEAPTQRGKTGAPENGMGSRAPTGTPKIQTETPRVPEGCARGLCVAAEGALL